MREVDVVDYFIHVGFRGLFEQKREKCQCQVLTRSKSVMFCGCTEAVGTVAVEEKLEIHLGERGETKWEQG